MLEQVMTGAVRLLRFPAGGLSCSIFSAGDNINQRELEAIGSVETASNVLTTDNFDTLLTLTDRLLTAVCNGTLPKFVLYTRNWFGYSHPYMFAFEGRRSKQSLRLVPYISFRTC